MTIINIIESYARIILYLFHKLERSHNISVPYQIPTETYQHLICLTGFGDSGSGALLDFFSEFDNITVIGGHDFEYGGELVKKNIANIKKNSYLEVDFLRHGGGVFYLESVIESNNPFIMDVAIKLFITLSEYNHSHYRRIYNDEYIRLTREFINQLVDFKTPTPTGLEYCRELENVHSSYRDYGNLSSPFTLNETSDRYIYHLKRMSRDEYRNLASAYINNVLKTIQSKPYLVMDLLIADYIPDMDRHKQYCGDLKEICIYRDPRDVYVSGILHNEQWIPKNIDHFILWYLSMVSPYLKQSYNDQLIIRFEDLVLNYDCYSQKILKFIEIDVSHHVHKNGFFDPAISAKNIGLWKKFQDQEKMEIIKSKLGAYCYPPA